MKALLFHSGVNEKPLFNKKSDGYLLWIGRLDKDKAPHYAVYAAKLLNMPLVILGKPVYQPDYFEKNKEIFESDVLTLMGVKYGKEKMDIISKAACVIYTLDKEYTEAGAGVLGEALSCGVPIAGMTWVGDDAICEAVDDSALGKIINAKNYTENEIAIFLSYAIKYCLTLDRGKVYELGSHKYDPQILVRNMFLQIEKAQRLNL